MFLTNAQMLSVIGDFAVIGFILGFLYDILRFFRKALGLGRVFVFITDFLSMIFIGLVLLFFALDTPTGNLRLIFILAAVFGITLYLITIGKITGFLAMITGNFFTYLKKKLKKYVINPIIRRFVFLKQKLTAFFGELHQKMKISKEKSHFGLKKQPTVLYNKNNSKMSELYQNGGEERNVIKAKIRKKV